MKVKRFLLIVAIISAGMVPSSLLVTKTDNWKGWVSLCLVSMSLVLALNNDNKY